MTAMATVAQLDASFEIYYKWKVRRLGGMLANLED